MIISYSWYYLLPFNEKPLSWFEILEAFPVTARRPFFSSFYGFPKEGQSRRQVGSMEGTALFKHSFVKRKTLSFLCAVCCVTLGKLSICWWQARGNVHGPDPCVHKCTTFTKPIQLFKSEFDVAYYVSTLSTNEKSWHRAAAGGNRKINSEKVSGQSSSIQLVSPYIISQCMTVEN